MVFTYILRVIPWHGENMVLRVTAIKLDEKTLELIDEIAEELGVTRSDVIREAIREYINKYTSEKNTGRTRNIEIRTLEIKI